MAEGTQSDLVVSISVDTTQVRSGFEQVVAMSEQYAKKVAEIWTKGFSTLVSQSAISHAMESAKKGATKALKPLVLSAGAVAKAVTPVFPSVNPGPGRIAAQGEMVSVAEKIRAVAQARAEATKIVGAVKAEQRRQVEEEREQARKKRAEERLANEQALSEMRARVREEERLKKIGERATERKAKYAEQDERAKAKRAEREEQKRLNELKRQERQHDQAILQAYAKALVIMRYLRRFIRAIIRLNKEWIDTANNIYQSQVKLAAALRVHNNLSDGQVRYLYQQVDALSKITGLSREVNYSAAQILASYVGAADGLTDMLGSVDALTLKMYGYNATAENAASVARIMGRALSGNLQTLKRYGIELTAAEEATLKSGLASRAEKVKALMEAISRYTGDLSGMVNTWAGQTNITKVYVESIKNELGLALQNFLLPIVKCVNTILAGVAEIAKWVRYISIVAFGRNIKGAEEMAGAAEQANEAYEELENRLLGFDKFNVLSGGNDGGLLSGIGDSIGIPEVDGDVPEWVDIMSKIPVVAEAIRVAVVGIGAALAIIVGHMAALALKGLIVTLSNVAKSIGLINGGLAVTKGLVGTAVLAVSMLVAGIYGIVTAIQDLQRWNDLSTGEKWLAVLKLVLGVALAIAGAYVLWNKVLYQVVGNLILHQLNSYKAATATNVLSASTKGLIASVGMLAAGIAVLALGIGTYVSNFEKMGTVARVLIPILALLAAALAGVAVAHAAAKAGIAAPVVAGLTAAAIAAGIVLAAGSAMAVKGYANGGIPDKGQLFIANENGPELVGNIGGQTSVANNAMITQAIEEAAYRGFSRANQGAGSVSVTLQGDGVRNDALVRALMPALKTEIKRQGGVKKAFGGE